ncbi:MAG: hypothetical protein JKX78_04980 [Alteromonadaceae bacterium]|nr:hypothetical protein [Alteromonadaceae bacterium]
MQKRKKLSLQYLLIFLFMFHQKKRKFFDKVIKETVAEQKAMIEQTNNQCKY